MSDQCINACSNLSSQLTNNFWSTIIAGHETWYFQYDPESKWQSLQWKQLTSPQSKKAHMSKSQMKKMLITFFNIKGIVHYEFIPQGQTVNQAYYVEILKWLNEAVCRKRPELLAQ
jgi:hypothetical protein